MKIWFGKHSGADLADLPEDYLQWLAYEFDPSPQKWQIGRNATEDLVRGMREMNLDLRDAAREELERRNDNNTTGQT